MDSRIKRPLNVLDIEKSEHMDTYTDGMSLEEQIGQVLMVGFWGNTPSQEIIDLIQHYHAGSIILFSRNVRAAQQVLELTWSLQMIAKQAGHPYPLLIAIDQENGIVQRLGEAATIFPGNMALGAIDSEEIAYKVALATGQELKAFGINMNLAPVVDVNNNSANPVIGVRSFGEDPQQVARLGAAMVKGYHAAGILSCLKHFPGHGDTAVDSHLALPTLPYGLERLEAMELLPFRSGIKAGADSVMIAHVAFPAMTRRDMLPATLSPDIVQGLLREKLGFNGAILSDCMEMKAISDTFGTERAAVFRHYRLALTWCRCLITTHNSEEALRRYRKRCTHTNSPHKSVQQAAERLLRLKTSYLSWDDLSPTGRAQDIAPTMDEVAWQTHIQLQNQAYELSTTLLRNEDALLPLRLDAGESIVVLSPQRNTMTIVEDRYYSDEILLDIIKQYHTAVRLEVIVAIAPGTVANALGQLLQTTSEADLFIVATVNAHLDEQQAELVRYLVSSGRRVIGIAVRNPYDLQVFPELRTYLATYEYSRPALVAAVRVLFGESQAPGHLPVTIPGLNP